MTTYRYKANNLDSYQSLATFIAPRMDMQVTFFPVNKTIVIEYVGSGDPEFGFVADHIDDNALDFHIEPVEIEGEDTAVLMKQDLDPASLRDLILRQIHLSEQFEQTYNAKYAAVEKDLEISRKVSGDHYNYWMKAIAEKDELKKQVNAIATLLASLAD